MDVEDIRKNEDELFERFGSVENNMLVVVGRKCTETAYRLMSTLSALYVGGGFHFSNGIGSKESFDGFENIQYSPDTLERMLLSQKVTLDSYDIPPMLLIFNRCISHNDSDYQDIIMYNNEYRYSTLTIVSEITDIDARLLSKMNVLIFLRDRNNVKMISRLRSIWERRFQKAVGFEQFSSCILSAVGVMKVGVITMDGMHMIKLGRKGPTIVNMYCFPKSTLMR